MIIFHSEILDACHGEINGLILSSQSVSVSLVNIGVGVLLN